MSHTLQYTAYSHYSTLYVVDVSTGLSNKTINRKLITQKSANIKNVFEDKAKKNFVPHNTNNLSSKRVNLLSVR